jgi:hypothetical protein
MTTRPPLDPPPIDPRHMGHYLAAFTVSRVPIDRIARMNPAELRELIGRLSQLSIPDAVKCLRRKHWESSLRQLPGAVP